MQKKEERSFETILSNVQFLSDLDLVRVMLTWAPTQRLLTDGQLLENVMFGSKGQLISKCLFGAIVSTKKPTKFF